MTATTDRNNNLFMVYLRFILTLKNVLTDTNAKV
jgi:hypothetical protein